MSTLSSLLLSGLLIATGSAVAASDTDGNAANANERMLRVLVHVDAEGEVTEIAPAVELKPGQERALRQTLDRLITRPAIVNHKPAASQFVMSLTIKTTQRDDGGYDARFEYLSSQIVPAGEWYWIRSPGRTPVLVPQGVSNFRNSAAVSTIERSIQDPAYGMRPLVHPQAPQSNGPE